MRLAIGPTWRLEPARIADAGAAGEGDELSHEGVVHAAPHQQPRAGDAGLAGGAEDAADHAAHRIVEVRIGEDDVRGLAAEFRETRFTSRAASGNRGGSRSRSSR